MMCSDQEPTDMHVVCGLTEGNAVVVCGFNQESYPGRRCPDMKISVNIHRHFCERWNLAPPVAESG
jgi:hypothetical protein